MESEALDDMITRMEKESLAKTERLRKTGRTSDARKTLTEWKDNLVRLVGKQQGFRRKTCDLYDAYLDLRRRHGMFIEEN